MKTRQLTGSEMLLAHCLWGPSIYPTLRVTRIIGETFKRSFIPELIETWSFQAPPEGQEPEDDATLTLVDDQAPLCFVFCPVDAGPAVLMHEFGHAVHFACFTGSIYWPVEKCEAFALLSSVNAERWKTLDSHEHEAFAAHAIAAKEHPDYTVPWERAYGLRFLSLRDQMDAIANDRPAEAYTPTSHSLPVGRA